MRMDLAMGERVGRIKKKGNNNNSRKRRGGEGKREVEKGEEEEEKQLSVSKSEDLTTWIHLPGIIVSF